MVAVAPAPTVVVTVEPMPEFVVVSVTVVAAEPPTVEVTVVDLMTVETPVIVGVEMVDDPIIEGARTYMAPSPTTSPTMRPAMTLTIPVALRFKRSRRESLRVFMGSEVEELVLSSQKECRNQLYRLSVRGR